MKKLFGQSGSNEEPVRRTWYGFNQPRPKLPAYLRPSKRLRSLDEFERPAWQGQAGFGDDGEVTWRGVARDTVRWLALFAIVVVVGGSFWSWLGGGSCVEVVAGFRIGRC